MTRGIENILKGFFSTLNSFINAMNHDGYVTLKP